MLNILLSFFKNLTIKDILKVGELVVVALLGALIIGYPLGVLNTKIEYSKKINILNKEHSDEILVHKDAEKILANNAQLWKTELDNAKKLAILQAQQQEKSNKAIDTVSNTIKYIKYPVISNGIKNDCKASDITINTDKFDGMLSCYTDQDPERCISNY